LSPPPPTPRSVRAHVEAACPGVLVMEDEGSLFFIHNPARDPAPARNIPFATVTVSDKYDPSSRLGGDRWRFNLGLPMASYVSMFGTPPPFPKDGGVADPNIDYARRDVLMPHPIYAAMGWVCVVSPDRAWEQAKGLLAQAWAQAQAKA